MTITIPEFDILEVINYISIVNIFLLTLLSWSLICLGMSIGGDTFRKYRDYVKWMFVYSLGTFPYGFYLCCKKFHPLIRVGIFACCVLGCVIMFLSSFDN